MNIRLTEQEAKQAIATWVGQRLGREVDPETVEFLAEDDEYQIGVDLDPEAELTDVTDVK